MRTHQTNSTANFRSVGLFRNVLFAVLLNFAATVPAQKPIVADSSPEQVSPTAPLANSPLATSFDRADDLLSAAFEAQRGYTPGYDFISTKDFADSFQFPGTNARFKIGGYVKLDAIQDFNAIGSTDLFDPGTIEVDSPQRSNSRFHARQTRLNIDTRWPSDFGPTRVFVEGDFFGDENSFRLRHAYGEVGDFLAGQTWTTFTDHNALPQTIDNQGGVSGISTRRGQLRWSRDLPWDGWRMAVAVENPTVDVDAPETLPGTARTPTPDLVARVRLRQDWGQLQIAGIARQLGYEPTGQSIDTDWSGGLNFTGWVKLSESDKCLFQIVGGEGIGSFRNLPDATTTSPTQIASLATFAWMVGYAHNWNERLSSNVTFNASWVNNSPSQAADTIHTTEYLAANLIWNPSDRIWTGIEYLYGTRTNFDGQSGDANRLHIAFLYELP
jgi:hypothetical protein